jgi:hypothetical protein
MITLIPTIYSKAKTVDKIIKKLNQDPMQVCNTPAAFKGYVMEFVTPDAPTGPVGTLDEYFKTYNQTMFEICDVEGGVYYE